MFGWFKKKDPAIDPLAFPEPYAPPSVAMEQAPANAELATGFVKAGKPHYVLHAPAPDDTDLRRGCNETLAAWKARLDRAAEHTSVDDLMQNYWYQYDQHMHFTQGTQLGTYCERRVDTSPDIWDSDLIIDGE